MSSVILVLNAGSSSIKFALFKQDDQGNLHQQPLHSGQIDGIGANAGMTRLKIRDAESHVVIDRVLEDTPPDTAGQHRHALDCLLGWLDAQGMVAHLSAVGHRVVHGGDLYLHPTLMTPSIADALAQFIPLAPLHQPYNLDAIRIMSRLMPDLPQVACFDTAFHATQPPVARQFALPRRITDKGVKRYGFHGLSYEYITRSLPDHLDSTIAQGRIIVAHLGNGASLCAIQKGQSVATSMGFTALDGLMMGTRTGNLDPGVLLYLMDFQGMDSPALTRMLYKESGLLGVSGISQDMRTLLGCAHEHPEAQEAIDLFCYRVKREIGSLAAAMGGLDALIFTGGIGEHAAPIREQICADSDWLGLKLNAVANENISSAKTSCISSPEARCKVHVIPTNEEWMIAQHTLTCLQAKIT